MITCSFELQSCSLIKAISAQQWVTAWVSQTSASFTLACAPRGQAGSVCLHLVFITWPGSHLSYSITLQKATGNRISHQAGIKQGKRSALLKQGPWDFYSLFLAQISYFHLRNWATVTYVRLLGAWTCSPFTHALTCILLSWTFLSVLRTAAAAAATSFQLCPTLCDPIDGRPPSSPVPGTLQARTLEWVAISFPNAWKWKAKAKSPSKVLLLATPWAIAHQAPPSMGFSRQEYWVGCHCLLHLRTAAGYYYY